VSTGPAAVSGSAGTISVQLDWGSRWQPLRAAAAAWHLRIQPFRTREAVATPCAAAVWENNNVNAQQQSGGSGGFAAARASRIARESIRRFAVVMGLNPSCWRSTAFFQACLYHPTFASRNQQQTA